MPKPAARVSDMTQHGGVIMPPGAIKTMIEMLPAARVTDMHTCPMVTGLVPHVGGPIIMGSFTTFIEMLPAARVMDKLICVGPPDMIAKGATKTFIGDPAGGASSTMSPPPAASAPSGGGSYQMTVGPLGEMSSPDGAPPANATTEGDPVEVATGRVFAVAEDFALPFLPGLSGERCYSTSAAAQDGAWGFGWSSRFDERIEILPEVIVYHTWVGRRILFPLIPPDEEYLFHLDEKIMLHRDGHGYRIEDAAGYQSSFTASPRMPSVAWLTKIADASGRGIEIARTEDILHSLRDTTGGEWSFEARTSPWARITGIAYAAPGEKAQTVCRLDYDQSGNLTSVQDGLGYIARYLYDPLHRLIQRTDRNGYAFSFQYDNLNRCVRTRGQDGLYDLAFTYAKDEPLTTVRTSLGHTIKYYHDALGLVTRTVNAEGREETFEYQGTNLVKRTDALGRVTEVQYDKYGRVTALKSPLGAETKRAYGQNGSYAAQDAEGNTLVRSCGPDGTISYGLKGEPAPLWTETVAPEQNLVARSDAGGHTTNKYHDPAGRLIKSVLPMGQTTEYAYDAAGRRSKTTAPDGSSVSYSYDGVGRLMAVTRSGGGAFQYRYDSEGNRSAFVDGNGRAVRMEYSSFNRLSAVSDATGRKVFYDYDSAGRLHRITDGRSNATTFDYDELGRLQRILYPGGRSEALVFDPAGQLRRFHDRSGAGSDWMHDDDGRLIEIRCADGDASRFSYDRDGRLTGAGNADSALSFTYDGYGRLTSETLNGETIIYSYDETGRLGGLVLPEGMEASFGYDPNGRLTEASGGPGGVHRFAYADAGPVRDHLFPNDLAARTTLSPLGLPETVWLGRHGDNRPLATRAYRHDGSDAVTEIIDSVLGRHAYRYDAAGRIESVQRDDEALGEAFAYDPAGNLVRMGNVEGVRYDPCNQLQEGPGVRCRHEAHGHLSELEDHSGTVRFVYDGQNRLVLAVLPGGSQAEYGYDPFGRRVYKRVDDQETQYLWAGNQMVRETTFDAGGAVVERRDYLYRPGSFMPLEMRINRTPYYFHCDHRGAPIRVSDASGIVVWTADYSAFGEARITDARIEQRLRLPGQYFDAETGLHYNRSRYYNPRWGRYVSPDPLGYTGGLNLYAYADSDPINKIDPLGRTPGDPTDPDALGPATAAEATGAARSVSNPAPAAPNRTPANPAPSTVTDSDAAPINPPLPAQGMSAC